MDNEAISSKDKVALGSGFITLILGGVVLWVGKATFEHAGQVAGIHHQIQSLRGQNEGLRDRYDGLIDSLNERTKSRFTREDAEKLVWRVKDIEIAYDAFKDKIHDDLGVLRIQLSNLQVQAQAGGAFDYRSVYGGGTAGSAEVAQFTSRLQSEISTLQAEVNRLHRLVGFNRGQIYHPRENGQPIVPSSGIARLANPDTR